MWMGTIDGAVSGLKAPTFVTSKTMVFAFA